MEKSKQLPLSPESTESVLKFMSLESRETINTCISSLRKTNKIVPYRYKTAKLDYWSLGINERQWTMYTQLRPPVTRWEFYLQMPRKVEKMIVMFEVGDRREFELDEVDESKFEKLIDAYLMNGTRIEKLAVVGIPECLEMKNPGSFQLKIAELKLDLTWRISEQRTTFETFQKILPFIEKSAPLRRIEFDVTEETLPMFREPLVLTSDTIRLIYPKFRMHERNPVDKIHIDLMNPHIEMAHHNFPVGKTLELVTNWKNSHRPIGNTFTLGIKNLDFIKIAFKQLTEKLDAIASKLPALG